MLHKGRCAIAFGDAGEGYARISYAYSMRHLEEALHRIEAFLKPL